VTDLLGCQASQAKYRMHTIANWNGTKQESIELAEAVGRNCVCVHDANGWRTQTCAPHRMLTDDQRALNGLAFYRQIAGQLRLEEFGDQRPAWRL
jgi:hypothetical protein